jgi:hypothetical protein
MIYFETMSTKDCNNESIGLALNGQQVAVQAEHISSKESCDSILSLNADFSYIHM